MQQSDFAVKMKTGWSHAQYIQAHAAGNWHELIEASCVPEAQPQVIINVVNENGTIELGVSVWNRFGVDHEVFPSQTRGVEFNLGGGSGFWDDKPPPNEISVGMNSERVLVGLPDRHHAKYELTFARRLAIVPTEPPELPTPTPTTLEEAVIIAAKKRVWMPINDGAALYKFAQQRGFGYPQTDEHEFKYMAATFIFQVFNKAIVYCKRDYYNEIWSVRKV